MDDTDIEDCCRLGQSQDLVQFIKEQEYIVLQEETILKAIRHASRLRSHSVLKKVLSVTSEVFDEHEQERFCAAHKLSEDELKFVLSCATPKHRHLVHHFMLQSGSSYPHVFAHRALVTHGLLASHDFWIHCDRRQTAWALSKHLTPHDLFAGLLSFAHAFKPPFLPHQALPESLAQGLCSRPAAFWAEMVRLTQQSPLVEKVIQQALPEIAAKMEKLLLTQAVLGASPSCSPLKPSRKI